MAEAAFGNLPDYIKQYTGIEICKEKAKLWGKSSILVMQFTTYFLLNVTELIYFEQYFG